ncbi:MAG: hypothetical protein ACLUF9_09025 [Oscillospiraceae bacterium]
MNTNFKTALFGGFDREDVVNYIQQISRENQQRVSALEEENHGLQERNRAMEAELNTLRRAVLENSAAADTCLQLQTQLRELQEQAQKLQKETEYLRAQAAENQSLKDTSPISRSAPTGGRRSSGPRPSSSAAADPAAGDLVRSPGPNAELNRQFCRSWPWPSRPWRSRTCPASRRWRRACGSWRRASARRTKRNTQP